MDGRALSAERSKAALLDAALTEFADHGLAGARVAEIARRAGVNKQLISYHFGGKDGLYQALLLSWQDQERAFREEPGSLDDLAVRYLDFITADPRWTKFAARTILDNPEAMGAFDDGEAEAADLRRRGKLAAGLDPQAVLLAITGMVTAPVLYGQAPANYADQLRRIIRQLHA